MKKSTLLLALLMASFSALAQPSEKVVFDSLKRLDIQATEIKPSPVAGWQMIFTDKGVVYLTNDGKYLLHGAMYDVSKAIPTNVTHQYLLQKVEKMVDKMIVYPADKEKFVVTVFTDISCGYCRKLHQQIKEYNNLGITIRYLAFPRGGMGDKTAQEMQSIWCMADRKKALDAAIKGDDVSPATCKTDIKPQYELGLQYGIQGTPAMILSDGTLVPGYREPKDMLAMLEEHQKMIIGTANSQKKSD